MVSRGTVRVGDALDAPISIRGAVRRAHRVAAVDVGQALDTLACCDKTVRSVAAAIGVGKTLYAQAARGIAIRSSRARRTISAHIATRHAMPGRRVARLHAAVGARNALYAFVCGGRAIRLVDAAMRVPYALDACVRRRIAVASAGAGAVRVGEARNADSRRQIAIGNRSHALSIRRTRNDRTTRAGTACTRGRPAATARPAPGHIQRREQRGENQRCECSSR
jgi:hypothetical protein